MGGAAACSLRPHGRYSCFNRRGDSLGGAAPARPARARSRLPVSIAGAILWGVLLGEQAKTLEALKFQSQGRFFGGCCSLDEGYPSEDALVSIAGAILWGVLPLVTNSGNKSSSVSIAGAILWGVLLACRRLLLLVWRFQSQGRFFGGCCPTPPTRRSGDGAVSIAGAILWGVLPEEAETNE